MVRNEQAITLQGKWKHSENTSLIKCFASLRLRVKWFSGGIDFVLSAGWLQGRLPYP